MPLVGVNLGERIVAKSTVSLYLAIQDASQVMVTGESPTVSIRRVSDGYFFNGTSFVDTSGVPTQLAMSEVSASSAPGLYAYNLVDPGLSSASIFKDVYQIRYVNTTTELWDVRDIELKLRDINTQGS